MCSEVERHHTDNTQLSSNCRGICGVEVHRRPIIIVTIDSWRHERRRPWLVSLSRGARCNKDGFIVRAKTKRETQRPDAEDTIHVLPDATIATKDGSRLLLAEKGGKITDLALAHTCHMLTPSVWLFGLKLALDLHTICGTCLTIISLNLGDLRSFNATKSRLVPPWKFARKIFVNTRENLERKTIPVMDGFENSQVVALCFERFSTRIDKSLRRHLAKNNTLEKSVFQHFSSKK